MSANHAYAQLKHFERFLEGFKKVRKKEEEQREQFWQITQEMHNLEMDSSNSVLNAKHWWPSLKKHIKLKEEVKNNQFALYLIFTKKGDCIFVSEDIEPYHKQEKREKSKKTNTSHYSKLKHSEESIRTN